MDMLDEEATLRKENQSRSQEQADAEEIAAKSQRILNKQKDNPPPIVPWRDAPITQRCMYIQDHRGLGCAAASVHHGPIEYRTLRPVRFYYG